MNVRVYFKNSVSQIFETNQMFEQSRHNLTQLKKYISTHPDISQVQSSIAKLTFFLLADQNTQPLFGKGYTGSE